jgi:large subunit ribosomal protein L19
MELVMELLKKVAKSHLRAEALGDFQVGDTVNVHTRITVISRSGGHGDVNDAFTVRRVVSGEGVERIFPDHSPRVVKVEVVRKGRVRRAKLFYLRDRVGKSTKVKEQLAGMETGEAAPAAQP